MKGIRISVNSVSLILLFFCANVLQGEFCALHVSVLQPGGYVGGRSEVSLYKGSQLVETGFTVDGKISFCDFGLGEHSVVLHAEKGCYESIVKGILLSAWYEQKVSLVNNICFFTNIQTSPPACHVLLKIDNWQKYSKYQLSMDVIQEDKRRYPLTIDSKGRIQHMVRESKKVNYELIVNGKPEKAEEVTCDRPKDIIRLFELNLP